MWTKILIGSFKYSRKNIRTVCYTPLLITKVVIDSNQIVLCNFFSLYVYRTPFPSVLKCQERIYQDGHLSGTIMQLRHLN
jgi:hypothetical protein